MFARINTVGLLGLNAFPVWAEIEATRGLPTLDIVGLGDAAVKESRERIASAFRTSGLKFPQMKMLVNLAPAGVKKTGSGYDFAIAVALLCAAGIIDDTDSLEQAAFIGETALNGEIRGVNGVLPMTILARKQGLKEIYVPYENAKEASVVSGITVYPVKTLNEAALHLSGMTRLATAEPYEPKPVDYLEDYDFADVKGQMFAKGALEVAASGGHNVIMIGSPGSGKSMLAKRLPSILPPMTFEESIETTNIHSVSGLIDKDMPLITKRPFRSPHHTISTAGLSGGGTIPKPGEISLAHNGLLFLDELAEFSRKTLEILRQPLEDKVVTISRASGTVTYPCSIMLVAAMNPCPCGYYGHPTRNCICTHNQVVQYLSRVSGPLLDRFDIHIEVAPVQYENIASGKKAECSAAIRERVLRAREIQHQRFKNTNITCNAGITSDILHEVCPLDEEASTALKMVFDKLGLSARAYDKLLKVARTAADMDGVEVIGQKHIAKATSYRSLDRKYWN